MTFSTMPGLHGQQRVAAAAGEGATDFLSQDDPPAT
jgi:hypothetical protein